MGHLAFILGRKGRNNSRRNKTEFNENHRVAYIVPESVVGGARRSGFCKSMARLSGPMMEAPRVPRSGLTRDGSLSSLQRASLGSVET